MVGIGNCTPIPPICETSQLSPWRWLNGWHWLPTHRRQPQVTLRMCVGLFVMCVCLCASLCVTYVYVCIILFFVYVTTSDCVCVCVPWCVYLTGNWFILVAYVSRAHFNQIFEDLYQNIKHLQTSWNKNENIYDFPAPAPSSYASAARLFHIFPRSTCTPLNHVNSIMVKNNNAISSYSIHPGG